MYSIGIPGILLLLPFYRGERLCMSFSNCFLNGELSLIAAFIFSSVFLFRIGRNGRAWPFLFTNPSLATLVFQRKILIAAFISMEIIPNSVFLQRSNRPERLYLFKEQLYLENIAFWDCGELPVFLSLSFLVNWKGSRTLPSIVFLLSFISLPYESDTWWHNFSLQR